MTAPITPDERAEWRSLADAATEGPWEATQNDLDTAEAEVARLREEAARPAPVWDEEAAWREAVRLYPTEHVGYDRPVPSDCQCDECYRRETQRDAYVAGRLAVVREHLPVRPDRETLARAAFDAGAKAAAKEFGLDEPVSWDSLDADDVERLCAQADAALALWPGESRAAHDREVAERAWDEGFRSAEEQHDGYAGVSGWTNNNPYREEN